MDSYPISKIVLALMGILQSAFVAEGSAMSTWLAFSWATAGGIVLCEIIWRSAWLKERTRVSFRVGGCFLAMIVAEAVPIYFGGQSNLSYGEAYLAVIKGAGERTNLSIPVSARVTVASATAQILSLNKKGAKCDPDSVNPERGCFAIPIETFWTGAQCTRILAGTKTIVPFVLIADKLVLITCNGLGDLDPFKQGIAPGKYEFEIGVDDPNDKNPSTRKYNFSWDGKLGGLKLNE
jgi:hypothetical protein